MSGAKGDLGYPGLPGLPGDSGFMGMHGLPGLPGLTIPGNGAVFVYKALTQIFSSLFVLS